MRVHEDRLHCGRRPKILRMKKYIQRIQPRFVNKHLWKAEVRRIDDGYCTPNGRGIESDLSPSFAYMGNQNRKGYVIVYITQGKPAALLEYYDKEFIGKDIDVDLSLTRRRDI